MKNTRFNKVSFSLGFSMLQLIQQTLSKNQGLNEKFTICFKIILKGNLTKLHAH